VRRGSRLRVEVEPPPSVHGTPEAIAGSFRLDEDHEQPVGVEAHIHVGGLFCPVGAGLARRVAAVEGRIVGGCAERSDTFVAVGSARGVDSRWDR